MTRITIDVSDVASVELSYTDQGAGHPVLLLHGGGGPFTVAAFGERLAAEKGARVITPTHPGFGGTSRPESLTRIRQLAALYIRMLDALELSDVTVVGNSIGGWIAAEMGQLGSPRIGSIVLVDAVGIEVEGHPVADFFALSFPEIAERSYFDPQRFRIDPAAMSVEQRAVLAENRATLAVYAGESSMADPTLRGRLASVAVATLVIWGESDRIVDADYGRAYASAIPGAEYVLMAETGHMPQLESPDRLIEHVWDFVVAHGNVGGTA